MEKLLFGLTPAEFWVWNYLVLLARQQGGPAIIFPRPGEDPRAEKVFCRKHLKNLLKALKAKRHLTFLLFPKSKAGQIEITLPRSLIGELEFPKVKLREPGFPNNDARGNRSSPITPLGNSSSPNIVDIATTLAFFEPSQAKLKVKLDKLLKQKQGDLRKELLQLSNSEALEIRVGLGRVVRMNRQRSEPSDRAKLFAMVRFLQSSDAIDKPQAWLATVAREADKEMRLVKNDDQAKVAGHHPG